MVMKIGVIGSCTSRDPFTTFFNKDYKSFFKVIISAQRTSVISFMSQPFNFDANTLKVIQNDEHVIQRTKNLIYDFNRCAFKELQQKEIDYLIIDNYFEIGFGILCIDNKFFVTNNTALHQTEFLNNLKEKRTITIGKNTDEYFKLYKTYCDKFFEYMETNLPNVRIILNKPRLVYNILTETDEIYQDPKYKSCSDKYNPLLLKLDNYVERNYNVDTIEFDKDTLAYENHRWGKAAVHYIDSYYTNFVNDVKYICLSDKIRKINNNLNNTYKKDSLKKSYTSKNKYEKNNIFGDLNNIEHFIKTIKDLDDNNTLISKYNSILEETNEIYNICHDNATSNDYENIWRLNGTASITRETDGTILTGEKWASINLKADEDINFAMGNYIFEFDVISINGNNARLNFYDGDSNQIILSKGHYEIEILEKVIVKKDNVLENIIYHDTSAQYFQLNFNINNDNVQFKFKNIRLYYI